MRFWLFRRSKDSSPPPASGRPSGRPLSIESLEHIVRSRVRMFLRHTWLVAILGTIVLVGLITAGVWITTEGDNIRVAAGPLDARFVQALSEQLTRQHRSLHVHLLATPNATAAAEAMSKNEADLAVLPSPLDDALNWPVVAILRQNVMALIVPAPVAAPPAKVATAADKTAADTGAKASKAGKGGGKTSDKTSDKTGDPGSKAAKAGGKAKAAKAGTSKSDDSDSDDSSDSSDNDKFGKVVQLAGKRIGIVTGNEASKGLLELVLGHYGVPLGKVTVSEIAPADVAAAVKNNQVDALFVAGAATGRAVADTVAAATHDGAAPNFIEIDQADGIAKRHPAFDSVDIDAGTFGGAPPSPADDLKSLSFPEYVVARKSVHDSVVATLAKTIFTARQSLAIAMPGEVKVEAPSTDKDAAVVLHPGALAYLSDSQQSFFDRYGDDIFYGMLIFPVFGSAIAGVASYLMSNTRTRRLRLLQRVLDLVRKAHAAQTLEALNHLQIDADNLVIGIVHQIEHEEFDESARMSFSFALDQLRFAIAARRTAIIDRAGAPAATGSGRAPAAASGSTAAA